VVGARKEVTVFSTQVPVWEIVVRTGLVYLALLLGLRLAGKREVGQMTAFDVAVILLVANAVQNAMVGLDTSLTGGLVAAGVLIGVNYALADLRERFGWFRRAVEGVPTLLISDGVLLTPHLEHERVDAQEVLMALREHGLDNPAQVRMAVLETDGSISVIPAATQPLRTTRRLRTRRRP
jgi:uncharacterized membrane protein YcaP (DUF421 family)